MNEFVKPKKMHIDVSAYVDLLLADGLEKDLHDNEEICETCHGTGVVIANNIYGLSDDPDKSAHFPYKHQSITFCPNCYNGIAHRCTHCGTLLSKGNLKCTCSAVKEQEAIERRNKYAATLEKAQVHEADELGTTFGMIQSDDVSCNDGYFFDWESFFEAWHEESDSASVRPQYVWGTYTQKINFDAGSIIEQACDDLHEDAANNISDEEQRDLQDLLNDWCEKTSGTETYYPDSSHKVKIPWEIYDATTYL